MHSEKNGNLQEFIDAFDAQRRYMDAFFDDIQPFSTDDGNEMVSHWVLQAGYVGVSHAHLYPFRARIWQPTRLAFDSVDEFRERFSKSAAGTAWRQESADGLVSTLYLYWCCEHFRPD